MEITVEKLTLAILIFLTGWQVLKSVLRFIAPKTATTADDRLLSLMEGAEKKATELEESQWVKDNGPAFWAQVEALSKTQIPQLKGVGKLAYFLGLAHQAYTDAKGKGLGAGSAKQLETLAAGLSASAKISLPGAQSIPFPSSPKPSTIPSLPAASGSELDPDPTTRLDDTPANGG